MTQEEKFEEAKRLYETANADQRYVLESLFPELKESEDERVRKEIISAIKEDWPGHTDWIAWLERQVQKSAWSEKYIADVFEKVGLAKIVREQSNDNLTIALQSAMIELSKFTPQPKQKWSEEDETKIKSIIALLKNPAVCTMDGNKGIIDASIKYLKSLKYRVQPQPKQEWSEEDEEMLKSIIALCDEKMKSTLYQSAIDHAIDAKNWLKDLIERVQSQSQLKPSDEQMKALDIAIRCGIQLGSWEEKALKLLKEQLFKLKKLREE